MQYILLHSSSFEPPSAMAAALDADGVSLRVISGPLGLDPGDLGQESGMKVLLLDVESRRDFGLEVLESFAQRGGAVVLLGAPGECDIPEEYPDDLLDALVPHPYGQRQFLLALRNAYRAVANRYEVLEAREEAATRTREITEITHIGSALSTERDLEKLLELIVSQARRLTDADAGSLYLVEERENGEQRLRFKTAQNHSRPDLGFKEFTVAMDGASLAGHVGTSRKPSVIADAYQIDPEETFAFDPSFDAKLGYRTRSVLTLPMQNHKGEVIGILQLINRKREFGVVLQTAADVAAQVLSFDRRAVDLALPLASQAAVAIENSRLHESIERLFEGFVTAAVTAIEQRDPTTSGHSQRVAGMTVDLAEKVDRLDLGPYRDVRFNREQLKELRYAGLLHDFGKVGVREEVLVKAKKLYPAELALIEQRFDFIRKSAESEFHRRRLEYLERHGRSGYDLAVERLEEGYQREVTLLEKMAKLVREANEPTVLQHGNFEELMVLAQSQYVDPHGHTHPFLGEHELRSLTLRKGSLGRQERREIESHVVHTYRFLSQIPWTRELRDVPNIAYGHHEKLDGGGYPRKISGDAIPIQTRMMTIADIYDALTAADRPYKRAVTEERALDILRDEVEGEMLDRELFRVFVEAKVFELFRRSV
jgi:HD-GYP domain-containing protein (c-di-GMP phosphodiesterase class II)